MVIHCQLPIIGYYGWRWLAGARQNGISARNAARQGVRKEAGGAGGAGKAACRAPEGDISADNFNVFCKTEMLTPKGEHSFPCSTRVTFDGRISFDGIATVKTL
jgi:hypothetical protein